MRDRPYFIWDLPITDDELRQRLPTAHADAPAQWQGRVMAEARFDDVWRYLTLDEIVCDWPNIQRHLGRKRRFWEFLWEFLLEGWRELGVLPR